MRFERKASMRYLQQVFCVIVVSAHCLTAWPCLTAKLSQRVASFEKNVRTFQTRLCRRGCRVMTTISLIVKEYGIHLVQSSAERWMLRHTESGSITDNENARARAHTHTHTHTHKRYISSYKPYRH